MKFFVFATTISHKSSHFDSAFLRHVCVGVFSESHSAVLLSLCYKLQQDWEPVALVLDNLLADSGSGAPILDVIVSALQGGDTHLAKNLLLIREIKQRLVPIHFVSVALRHARRPELVREEYGFIPSDGSSRIIIHFLF